MTVNPKEVDAQIAEVEFQLYSITMRIASVEDTIKHYQKQTEKYPSYQRYVDEQLLVRSNLLSERLPFIEQVRELNSQYTGWTRAFLVVNSNGHIHKNRSCNTCFETTKYYWLTELSGDDEMTIVEKAGEKACTVCYPDAPSEYLARKTQLEHPDTVRARAEREAKRAEREAKRIATGIWNPDGSPLKVMDTMYSRYVTEIKNERTAESEAVICAQHLSNKDLSTEHREFYSNKLNIILTALCYKRGVDIVTLTDLLNEKARKKNQRELREYAKYQAQREAMGW